MTRQNACKLLMRRDLKPGRNWPSRNRAFSLVNQAITQISVMQKFARWWRLLMGTVVGTDTFKSIRINDLHARAGLVVRRVTNTQTGAPWV